MFSTGHGKVFVSNNNFHLKSSMISFVFWEDIFEAVVRTEWKKENHLGSYREKNDPCLGQGRDSVAGPIGGG